MLQVARPAVSVMKNTRKHDTIRYYIAYLFYLINIQTNTVSIHLYISFLRTNKISLWNMWKNVNEKANIVVRLIFIGST